MAKTNAELLKEIEFLKEKVQSLSDDVTYQKSAMGMVVEENERLQKINKELHRDKLEPTKTCDPLTRNDIIKGLLPSLPLNIHNTEAHVGNLLNCADILLKKING